MAGEPADKPSARSYWAENLRLVGICLAVWFVVSFGCGILFVDFLNQFSFAGFKLGFWFAQQGAMLVFLVLIAVYVLRMAAIDRKHGVDEDEAEGRE
jgi:putative solute:sodium symporter small subunit